MAEYLLKVLKTILKNLFQPQTLAPDASAGVKEINTDFQAFLLVIKGENRC
jgi:hypothetical protein